MRVPILIDLVPKPDPITAEEFISRLLEGEGLVFLSLFEVGGANAFFVVRTYAKIAETSEAS